MAEKFPIGEALNETFQFALNRWGTILRFGWAPMLAAIAVVIGTIYAIVDIPALERAGEDPEMFANYAQFFRVSPPMAVLAIIAASFLASYLLSGFMASIFRLVALGEERPGFVHLRFDGPAQRVFVANIILSLINFAVYVVALLVASAVTGVSIASAFGAISEFFRIVGDAAASGAEPDASAIGSSVEPVGLFFIAVVFSILPLIFINIRLAPFLSGSAAENRLLLAGSFRMTGGHFWSLLGFYFLLSLMLLVIFIVFNVAIGIVDILSNLPSEGAFAIIGMIAGILSFVATVAYQLFVYGVQFSAPAIIYRRLKTGA